MAQIQINWKVGDRSMPDLGNINIEVDADVTKAINALDRLSKNLNTISKAFSGLNTSGLGNFISGINHLSKAMINFNNSGVKTQDFTRLAKNINALANVNNAGLTSVANGITQINASIASLSNVGQNANNMAVLANAISRLGYKNVSNAITNIPRLATSLNQLFVTLSKSPQVSQNIISMTNAIANLATQGSKVGTASNALVSGLQNTHKVADKTGKKMNSLASAFGKFYASYFLVIRGIKGLMGSIEGTTDYLEAYNYYTVATEKVTSEWNTSAEELTNTLNKLSGLKIEVDAEGKGLLSESGAKNLGLNIKEITQYASQLVSVTNSLGLAGETSISTASALTRLAGDISSLFNIDYSQAATNLQSGLIGQSRALYKFGIDITNNTLQQYAFAEGIEKSVTEMGQGEKMMLRLLAILDQSKVSWGDLANTIESPANMIRQFKNNVSELGTVFGQLFIPMLQRVMPIINGVTIALKGLFTNIAGFAGIELDLGSFGQGYSDLEENLDGVGDAYEDVTNKTKEWKNELYGFDEIEKQSDITAPSLTTEGQDTIDLSDSIQKALADYDKVWNEAFGKMENNALNISKNISKALQPLEDIFADLFSGDFAGAGENTGLLAMNILNYFTDAIESVEWDELGENVADYINGVFESIDGRDIAKGINAFADMFWDTFSNLLKNVDYWEIIKTIGEVLLNLDWVTIGKLFLAKKGISLGKDLFSGLLTGFKGGFNANVFLGGNIPNVMNGVGTLLGQSIVKGLKSPLMAIPAVIGYALNSTSNYYEDLAEDYADFGSISDEVQGKLDNLKSKIDEINGTSLDINTDFGASDDEIESIETLAGKYFNLKEKVYLTSSEQALLNSYRDALVKSNPAFEQILNDNSLRYEDQKKAIEDIISELKKKARMESASALISKAGENVFNAENVVAEAKEEFEAQKQVVLDLDKEIKAGQAEIEKLLKKITSGKGDINDYKKLVELTKKYNTAIFSESMKAEYGWDLSAYEGIGSVVETLRDEVKERDALNDKYIEAKDALNNVNWELDYYVSVAEGVIDADMTMYDYKQKINEENYILEQTSAAAASAYEDMEKRAETASKNTLNTMQNNVTETSNKMSTVVQNFDKATGGVISGVVKAVNQTKTEMDKLLKPKVGVELYNQWFNLAYKLGERYNDGWKAIKTVIVTTLDGIYNYTPVSTRQELSPSLAMLVNTNGSKLNQPQSTYSAYDYFLAQSGQQQTQQQPQNMLFNITIGGKEVTDYVITDVNNRTMQTGRNPFGF